MDEPLSLPPTATIREVGPRDGLQAEHPLTVEDRVRFIDAVSRTGVRKIEAVSFVSSRAVPAMAEPAEVWARIDRADAVAYSALVPNRRGAEAAAEAGGFASLQAFLAASNGYNGMNLGKSVEESVLDVRDVLAVGADAEIPVEVTVSAAFGDPYEGRVDPGTVLSLVARMLDAGASAISLGDTTGVATPRSVWHMAGLFAERFPDVRLNLHFHDTRGTAIANVLAALQAGVTEFDASAGGLGGSPFAPDAGGNVPTEDLAWLLAEMGVETGVDLGAALAAAKLVGDLVGHAVPGHLVTAGPSPD
jgi:hydroxymethylglutaryl-CoA lyase